MTGAVLERHADPGSLLLNGVPALATALLANGDVVGVREGVDRTERIVTTKTALSGFRPGDPQFTVSTWRLMKITRVGRISGKVIATRYVPFGSGRRSKVVALTFDDGPWVGSTRPILRVLRRLRVKATFFVIGYLAARHPGIVRDELRAGMTVGNHSWDHPLSPPFDQLPRGKIHQEMSLTDVELEALGDMPSLFRAPGGSLDPAEIAIADALGLRVVMWSVDPRDWEPGVSARHIVGGVLSHVRAGSIIELHDGGGDRSATLAALPRIIRGIRKRGFRLVALG